MVSVSCWLTKHYHDYNEWLKYHTHPIGESLLEYMKIVQQFQNVPLNICTSSTEEQDYPCNSIANYFHVNFQVQDDSNISQVWQYSIPIHLKGSSWYHTCTSTVAHLILALYSRAQLSDSRLTVLTYYYTCNCRALKDRQHFTSTSGWI